MARQISQLTAAATPIDGANDVLWIEQNGLPRKVSAATLGGGAKLYAESNFDPAGGWYRIASLTNSGARGSAQFWVSNRGSSGAPGTLWFRVSKSWQSNGTDLGIQVLGGQRVAASNVIDGIRVTTDGTTVMYVEVQIEAAAGAADWEVYVQDENPGLSGNAWAAIAFTAGATSTHTRTLDLTSFEPVFALNDPGTDNTGFQVDSVGRIRISPGSLASPGMHFHSDPDTGLYQPSAGQLDIVVNQASTYRFFSSKMQFTDSISTARDAISRLGVGTDEMMVFGPNVADRGAALAVGDTRDTSNDPDDYTRIAAFEFKQVATIGIGERASGTYSGLLTLAPWSDGSGGYASQLAFSQNGIYYRADSMSATSWAGSDADMGRWTQVKVGTSKSDGRYTAGSEMAVFYPRTSAASNDVSGVANTVATISWASPVNTTAPMMSAIIKGYNYNGETVTLGGGAWAIAVSGYPYSPNWINTSAHTLYGNPPFRTVRFWADSTNSEHGIIMGDLTDDWAYPKFWLDEVMISFVADPWNTAEFDPNGTCEFLTAIPGTWTIDATECFIAKTVPGTGAYYPGGRIYPQNEQTASVGQTPGNIVGFIDDNMTQYGSINVGGASGSSGTFEGYAIAGRYVFMGHPTEERCGIYDDYNNSWTIQWNAANATSSEQLSLYARDNITSFVAARTQDDTLTGNTSAFEIRDHGGAYYDAGFNILPTFNFNATDTLEANHCGHMTGKTNTTAYTLTGPTSSDLDFPVGGVCTVANLGSSVNYTISDTTTCTMYYIDGSSVTDIVGSGTLAPGGMVTLWRYSSTAIYIWGLGFTA